MKKAAAVIAACIVVALLGAGILAYFVSSFDPHTRQYFDGLGRPLGPAPWIARFIFAANNSWPGWAWFFADMIVFWGGVGLAAALYNYSQKSE